MVSFTLRPLHPQGKGFLCLLNRRLGGAQNRSWAICRRINTPARNRTMIAWSFSPWPDPLPRLPVNATHRGIAYVYLNPIRKMGLM